MEVMTVMCTVTPNLYTYVYPKWLIKINSVKSSERFFDAVILNFNCYSMEVMLHMIYYKQF
jgi:hypothetical protein